jgi:chaperonin GroES
MLQPLGARVLVQRLEAEEKSSGGIILPEAAQERPREGTVIAVGPGEIGEDGEPMGVSVEEGDVVIYASFGGTEVSYDGEDYLIINENDILAVRE